MMAPKRLTHPRRDLTGRSFGRLAVVRFARYQEDTKARRYDVWLCRCSCGGEKEIRGNTLITAGARSCGCLRKEAYAQFGDLVRDRNSKPPGVAAENDLWGSYVARAKKFKRPMTITKEAFLGLCAQDCHYCGVPPVQIMAQHAGRNGGVFWFNGIDRKDSSGGYEPGNVLPCCEICNKAKRGMDYDRFLRWVKQLVEFRRDK